MAKKSQKKSQKRTKQSLQPLREQLQVLVDMANSKARILLDSGTDSRAIDEARRTLSKYRLSKDDVLFRSDLKSKKLLNKEFARVNAFLGDYTSSIEGAQEFKTDLTSLRGAFGGEWLEKTGKTYDTSRINEDIAKKAFEAYRKTVEAVGGWERAVGLFQGKESLIGYGSETLITNIYDMYLHSSELSEEEILIRARNMVDEGIKAYGEMSERQVSGYDYGIIFDDESVEARRSFYAWRYNYQRKKG